MNEVIERRLDFLNKEAEGFSLCEIVKELSKKYRKTEKSISATTLKKLEKYKWPGNIRELQHAIERAIIMSEKNVLHSEDFFFLAQVNETNNNDIPDSLDLEEVERNTIKKAINKHSGNISKAAKELGLTRASLYRRLEKHGI